MAPTGYEQNMLSCKEINAGQILQIGSFASAMLRPAKLSEISAPPIDWIILFGSKSLVFLIWTFSQKLTRNRSKLPNPRCISIQGPHRDGTAKTAPSLLLRTISQRSDMSQVGSF